MMTEWRHYAAGYLTQNLIKISPYLSYTMPGVV